MMKEHTRELVYLRPDVLVVYDRAEPKDTDEWRLHLPAAATAAGDAWQMSHGGAGLTLLPLASVLSPKLAPEFARPMLGRGRANSGPCTLY